MSTLSKTELKTNSSIARMPKSALSVLNILDDLENFTSSIRKKVLSEIRANSKSIQVSLDSI